MAPMTDRGQPIVDGAPACPFVAFDDDRDARAASPDHRHRCYAEIRPATRALAHQEAYCLSSAFPVCPTFQDWARREAARATASAEVIPPPVVTGAEPGPDAGDRVSRAAELDMPQRNPPRDWSAPPPWLGAEQDPEDDDERDIGPLPTRGGGLSGSFADRVASGPAPGPGPAAVPDAPAAPAQPAAPEPPLWRDPPPGTVTEPIPAHLGAPVFPGSEGAGDQPSALERPRRAGRAGRGRERDRSADGAGPLWERPRRREAYPTIKTRMGLAGLTVPSILIGLAAVLIAAVALFFLPAILGIGSPHATGSPSGSPGASTSGATSTPGSPTVQPASTPQVYLVQSGDTMSKIANRFGIPLQRLIDANKATVPNPDRLDIGLQLIIPAAIPTSLPGVSPAASP